MKKKTNPRNVPVDKRSINLDAIVDEAMKDDMQHAWLLVGNDAGGLYGDAYDVSICEGSCQGFAVFSGKVAAEHIAANS